MAADATGSPPTTVYQQFKVTTVDLTGDNKSNIANPVAISVTQPVTQVQLSNCKLGKGNKKPFLCYDSDATTASGPSAATNPYTPIRLTFANYNTQVSCNGQGCANPALINDFKICSVALAGTIPGGCTGAYSATSAVIPTVATNPGALNEQIDITLTLPSCTTKANVDSLLSNLVVTANFMYQSQTCP